MQKEECPCLRLTCTSMHSFLSKNYLFPSSQTYAFPTPGSASAFSSQGIRPYLCSCCSSCSFVEVAKWMCLKFRLFQKAGSFCSSTSDSCTRKKSQNSGVLSLSWCMFRLTCATHRTSPLKHCCSQPGSLWLKHFICLLGYQAVLIPSSGIGLPTESKLLAQTGACHSLSTSAANMYEYEGRL